MHTVADTNKTEKKEQKLDARQLLGVKGAAETDNKWAIRLQLTKPVTWVPLIWGVLCGAAASGEFTWTAENVAKSLLTMTMSGPLLTGYTQARSRRILTVPCCPNANRRSVTWPAQNVSKYRFEAIRGEASALHYFAVLGERRQKTPF